MCGWVTCAWGKGGSLCGSVRGEGECVRRFEVCVARMDLEGCWGELVGSWVGGWVGVRAALWMG